MKKMKPYIVCYMMTSLDGRIDCAMTAQLPGTNEYYDILEELDLPTTISGHTTAKLEMADGTFTPKDRTAYAREGFSKKTDAKGYEVVTDSKGDLLWDHYDGDRPLLIITSEKVTKEYLSYLDEKNISWIVCGQERVDVKRAVEILADAFDVSRLGLVGGPTMNSAFLNAGLTDEVIILIGPGIDGRSDMPSVFEGREDATPLPLTLTNVKTYDNGAVLLKYKL